MVPLTFSPLSLPASLSSSPCVLLYASANINQRTLPGASHLLSIVIAGHPQLISLRLTLCICKY